MDLVLLLLVVVGGVGLILGTVHLLGGSVRVRLGDEEAVLARYRRDVVGSAPVAVVVDREGHAALVDDPEVGVAAVVALGDGVVIRPLRGATAALADDVLEITPEDWLLGPFRVRGDGERLRPWLARLTPGGA